MQITNLAYPFILLVLRVRNKLIYHFTLVHAIGTNNILRWYSI